MPTIVCILTFISRIFHSFIALRSGQIKNILINSKPTSEYDEGKSRSQIKAWLKKGAAQAIFLFNFFFFLPAHEILVIAAYTHTNVGEDSNFSGFLLPFHLLLFPSPDIVFGNVFPFFLSFFFLSFFFFLFSFFFLFFSFYMHKYNDNRTVHKHYYTIGYIIRCNVF